MLRRTAALFLALSLLPGAALAQGRGSEADQEACTPDVFKLCGDYIPNEGPILACLQAKHAQLSAACEPVIFPHSEASPGSSAPPRSPAAPRRAKHKRKHRQAI